MHEVASSLLGFHATTAATIYLSAWARIPDFASTDLDAALYERRSLVKQLAMRRTLFVMERDVLAEAIGAVGGRVARSERTNLLRDLRRGEGFGDPDEWIDTAAAAVRAELGQGQAYTSTELRRRLPDLDRHIDFGEGKSWSGRAPLVPRVLNMMSAAGEIVRGPNRGGWHLSRPSWVSMDAWLGTELQVPDVHDAHVALIRRWLAAFGPGTETDIVWWLGSTKTAVRAALREIDVVEVDLESGDTGYVLAGDDGPVPESEPDAALLPELDPTLMGHKQRGFYVGEHTPKIFDSNGNGGQSAWWGGQVVGGWRYRDDRSVEVKLWASLPASARARFDQRAEELGEWLGDTRPLGGYPAPFMRE